MPALLAIGHAHAHALARGELLGVGQPAVQGVLQPGLARSKQGVGVGKARNLGGLAAEQAPVRRANPVVVQAMAGGATRLVERAAQRGVAAVGCG